MNMKGSVRTKDPAAQRQTRAVPMIKLTGRKTIGTAEKALRESETKFRDLAEKSLVGIYLIQDDIFKYVNPRFAEIYDYTVEEIVDKLAPGHLVSAEDRDLVLENIRKRIEGETKSFHYEFRSVTKTGRNITVEVYGSGTIYEGKPALIGTLLDITARKRNEELLRQAEEKYRGIFENAVEGIFQSTPKGQFVVVNPALAKMMGYGSPDQLVAALTDIRYQLYVEPAKRDVLLNSRGYRSQLMQVSLFDSLTNNADRKAGHCFVGRDGKLWGIDHGLTFHRVPKLRTVIWDFCGQPIGADLLAALARLLDQKEDAYKLWYQLGRLLSPEEVEACANRLQRLLSERRFPELDPYRNLPRGFF